MFQPDYYERAEELARALEDVKYWKEGSKSGRDSKDFEEESGRISNVSSFNAKCLGQKSSVSSRKSEAGERSLEKDRSSKKSDRSSSYGSCSCSSSRSKGSSSSLQSPPGTICTCPTYPPKSSSSSRSSKSNERSGESITKLKNCKCK